MFGGLMLTVGYIAGSLGLFGTTPALAQLDTPPSEDAENKVRSVNRAMNEAVEQLRQDGRYKTVTTGTNSFIVMMGGGDAGEDLASGNGVDPETFAALYAGQVVPEFSEQIGWDAEGRLTYEGKPVQLYSKKKLESIYKERKRIQEGGI